MEATNTIFFTESGMSVPELMRNIKEIITALRKIGLKVLCIVCDQSTIDCSSIKKLKEETSIICGRKNIENRHLDFLINNEEVVPIYNPPQLLKCMRNNMLQGNVHFTIINGQTKIARWNDIVAFYEMGVGDEAFRMCNRLTDMHIYKDKIKKMKIKLAAQIFSQRSASVM